MKALKQAEIELKEELFREEVERHKQVLRTKRKSWFPWRIVIININKERRNERNY